MSTLQERLRANPLPLPNVMELCREAADRIDALEAENAALRADAERWRYARKALLWAPSGDGEVKWVMFLVMPEPDVSESGLTPDSVAHALDAAIDAAIARSKT